MKAQPQYQCRWSQVHFGPLLNQNQTRMVVIDDTITMCDCPMCSRSVSSCRLFSDTTALRLQDTILMSSLIAWQWVPTLVQFRSAVGSRSKNRCAKLLICMKITFGKSPIKKANTGTARGFGARRRCPTTASRIPSPIRNVYLVQEYVSVSPSALMNRAV